MNVVKIAKTNAARILDRHKIPYELIPYEVDEKDLGAIHVAAQLDEPIEMVFKTLVLRGNKSSVFICVVPGAEEVNLKLAAKISGNKKCDLVPMKEVRALTGYIRGGCSPLGMKKPYPVFLHRSAMDFPFIYISAGTRGLQIKVSPQKLAECVKLAVCELI